jgi:hypothetical protein
MAPQDFRHVPDSCGNQDDFLSERGRGGGVSKTKRGLMKRADNQRSGLCNQR